jgi:hypothetical protein
MYVEQGHRDLAVEMYEKAVRNQPDNGLYRQKWEGLKMSGVAPRAAPRMPNSHTANPYAAGARTTRATANTGANRVAANGGVATVRRRVLHHAARQDGGNPSSQRRRARNSTTSSNLCNRKP